MNPSAHKAAAKRPPTINSEVAEFHHREFKDGLVLCQSSLGEPIRGKIIRLDRLVVSFEIYEGNVGFRLSEVLNGLKVFLGNREAFAGRAVLSNLMQTATMTICEVKLDEPGIQTGIHPSPGGGVDFKEGYTKFFARWQRLAQATPEFKLAVSDLQSYLTEAKLYLDQIEIAIAGRPPRERAEIEGQIFQNLSGSVLDSINILHERFEHAASKVPLEQRTQYQALVHRQLHPLFLCAPFGHRTFYKPLGYAGDYEIMNMIHRNTFEGSSLYARFVHYWLVNQWAAKSVRNRIAHMKGLLLNETARVMREGRAARILNIGCGPAREIQEFMTETAVSDHARFTLLDFDEETLGFVSAKLGEIKRNLRRGTEIRTIRASVTQIILQSMDASRGVFTEKYDVIYCGGLFDYLSDRVCKQLVTLFYGNLIPGGLTSVANMNNEYQPFHQMVEYLLDWHLIYRNAQDMAGLKPDDLQGGSHTIFVEPVAVNFFLELRKPEAAPA